MTLRVREDGVWKPVGGGAPPATGYQRPHDWLPLPELTAIDKQFSALVAVYPHESNYLAFAFSGAYEVDWGDGGSPAYYSSGAQASHIYDYDDLPGTECDRGYRQAIVTVTPTTETWSSVDIGRRYPGFPYTGSSTPLLDVVVAGSTIDTMIVNGNCSNKMMEQFHQVGTWNVTEFWRSSGGMFEGCTALQSIPELDTSSGEDFDSMFEGCYSLQSIPELDTSSGTYFGEMFNGCSSLQSIPELDTSSGTYFGEMFSSCYSLQSIPELDTSSSEGFGAMFSGCTSLQSIPELDTSGGEGFGNMFNGCTSLGDAPLQGTSRTISYNNTRLSRAALVRVFNGLGTASGSQTITITGTPGAASLTTPERDIATGKGWTISG